jgi:hypothetical protein
MDMLGRMTSFSFILSCTMHGILCNDHLKATNCNSSPYLITVRRSMAQVSVLLQALARQNYLDLRSRKSSEGKRMTGRPRRDSSNAATVPMTWTASLSLSMV